MNIFKAFINGYLYSDECSDINHETDLFEQFQNSHGGLFQHLVHQIP